jgi:endonuclease YncB( thermonuclease family)
MRWFHIPFVMLLAAAPIARAELIQALVLDVVDGDTLQIVDTSRKVTWVRLAGVDAPELSQSFGQASKLSLSAMVNGDYVSVHVQRVDARGLTYGRVVLRGYDINLAQLRKGMAWFDAANPGDAPAADAAIYRDMESKAQAAGVGLWSESAPVAPWTFKARLKR